MTSLITHAISIRQPWAWAICSGFKTVENRTRKTSYRGRVAIHASTAIPDLDAPEFHERLYHVHTDIFRALDHPSIEYGDDYDVSPFHFGCIVGSVEIVDCVEFAEGMFDCPAGTGPTPDLPHSVWASGPNCIMLRNARRYRTPVYCRGQVALPWKLPPKVAKQIDACERDLLGDPSIPVDSRNSIDLTDA